MPFAVISCVLLTAAENINELITQLEKCIQYNKMTSKNKYLALKCSLKDDVFPSIENIDKLLLMINQIL